jgi:antitoxin component of RelBE/YafQ-DinJ toxin-antitoxin module
MRRLERIAKANGIDVSDVVRMSLNKALPDYEAKAA